MSFTTKQKETLLTKPRVDLSVSREIYVNMENIVFIFKVVFNDIREVVKLPSSYILSRHHETSLYT